MQKPADWLVFGIGILAADLVVRHTLDVPSLIHVAAFVIGGAAIMWGIAKILLDP